MAREMNSPGNTGTFRAWGRTRLGPHMPEEVTGTEGNKFGAKQTIFCILSFNFSDEKLCIKNTYIKLALLPSNKSSESP